MRSTINSRICSSEIFGSGMSCTIPSDNDTETGPGVAAKGAGEGVEKAGALVLALNGDASAGGKVGGGCDCVVSGKMMLLKNSVAAPAMRLRRFGILNPLPYASVFTDKLVRFWITTCSLFLEPLLLLHL